MILYIHCAQLENYGGMYEQGTKDYEMHYGKIEAILRKPLKAAKAQQKGGESRITIDGQPSRMRDKE